MLINRANRQVNAYFAAHDTIPFVFHTTGPIIARASLCGGTLLWLR